uniref:Uncharacterized protein n=1 Tax=Anguilla anguilla TaxID=7936 RepID=A0A0E9RG64_ANGAN
MLCQAQEGMAVNSLYQGKGIS